MYRPITYLLWMAMLVVVAQSSKLYRDGHGGELLLPLGDRSFADAVVHFERRTPYSLKNSIPEHALGVPDRRSLALSCGGSVVVAFRDNLLTDIEGADLHIFEIGPKVEPTSVAISMDGKVWREVGEVAGGKSQIDIAPFVKPDEAFAFVRLVDLKSACHGRYPGADIDAVAAIGSTVQLSLASTLLFDTGKHTLKPSAFSQLHSLLRRDTYRKMHLRIVGHTDDRGGEAYNLALSLRRAKAVKAYLIEYEGFEASRITLAGYGESRPLLPNTTPANRAKNRRVLLSFSADEE